MIITGTHDAFLWTMQFANQSIHEWEQVGKQTTCMQLKNSSNTKLVSNNQRGVLLHRGRQAQRHFRPRHCSYSGGGIIIPSQPPLPSIPLPRSDILSYCQTNEAMMRREAPSGLPSCGNSNRIPHRALVSTVCVSHVEQPFPWTSQLSWLILHTVLEAASLLPESITSQSP